MKTEIKVVRVADLRIDSAYQREPSMPRVERMAANWRPELAGIVTVAARPDGLYVTDGQHRFLAARRANVPTLVASVFHDLTQAEEASLFAAINTSTVRPKTHDLYRARVLAGDPTAVAVDAILRSRGVAVVYGSSSSREARTRTTRATSSLESAYEMGTLGAAIDVLIEAWPDDPMALDARPISAVAGFIYVYKDHPKFKKDELAAKLAAKPVRAVVQRAAVLSDGSTYATGGAGATVKRPLVAAVLEFYNRGRRSGQLPEASIADIRAIAAGQNPWIE